KQFLVWANLRSRNAAASLKRDVLAGEPTACRYLRSRNAAASLKRDVLAGEPTACRYLRSRNAAASLKHVRAAGSRLAVRASPQPKRCGLIEARETSMVKRLMSEHLRSRNAAASLKRDCRAAAAHRIDAISAAETLRPH